MLSISFLAACIIFVLPKKHKIFMTVMLLIIVLVYSLPYLKVTSIQNYPDTFYSTNQDTTTVKNEYMPKWVKNIPSSMYNAKVENLSGGEEINISEVSPNKTVFSVYLTKQSEIAVNTIYFPGWLAYVNDKKVDINYENDKGTINLILNKGENNVRVEFGETNIRNLSNIISVASLILLIIASFPMFKNMKKLVKI